MIHRYKLGGMNIVLDICSGSVHLVDEVAYDMIGLFETESREAITAAMLEKYGDRETKLVFIGQHMDKQNIIERLDNCLDD